MADYQAGTSQDIYHEGVYLFWDMVDVGMVIEAPPEVTFYVEENFLDAAAALSKLDGKCYGYPTEVQAGAMMVNGTALDAIGHSRDPESLPKTWEEFADLSMALTKVEGNKKVQAGWVWPEAYSEPWFELMDTMHASEGLPFIDIDRQTCNMDSEVGISLMKWYERMAVDDQSTTLGLIGWYDAYPEGVGTMMLLNEWLLKYNILGAGGQELLENTVTALIPTRTGENFKSTFVTYNYMVSSQCEHPEAAWEFLQWLNEMPEARMGNWMVEVMGFVPNHKTGMPYPDWWTKNMVETWTVATSKELAVPYPVLPQVAKVQNICMDMANAVAQGSLTVEEACSQGAKEIEQSVFSSL
jgi:multiple sugar transport system substrate-binding protein